jgi:hypothetical protein
MKSPHFGEGLECSHCSGAGRFKVLVLIPSLAAFLLWLLGIAAERAGLHERLHPSNRKRRVYSKLFLARLLVMLDSCHDHLESLMPAIVDIEHWVVDDHDALLLK